MAKKAEKEKATKRKNPLAGRQVFVIGPTVREALASAERITKHLNLKDRPNFDQRLPRGLAQWPKVAIVTASQPPHAYTAPPIDGDWVLAMTRDLDDISFFTEEELFNY